MLSAEAPSRAAVDAFLGRAVEQGRALVAAHALRCEVYPPVPAAMARRAGLERGQVLTQSTQRSALHTLLPLWRTELERIGPRRVRWNLDVDPLGFA
jgi:primosomal protein N' (replication factor Y)